jgi:hypothetical protein
MHPHRLTRTAVSRSFARAALLATLTITTAVAQDPASPGFALFDPDGRVPLSGFVGLVANGCNPISVPQIPPGGTTLTFHVHPDVVQYVGVANLRVAVDAADGSPVTYALPTSVSATTGEVTFFTNSLGKYVVVGASGSAAPSNDFPIATHWRNPGTSGPTDLGGFEPGSSHGVDILRVIPNADPACLECTPTQSVFDEVSEAELADILVFQKCVIVDRTLSTQPYPTDIAAIFDDGSGNTVSAPAYETYSGENYSLLAVDDLAAIQLSDFIRSRHGWPVVHHNAPIGSAPLGSQVQDDVPFVQLVHTRIVDNPNDPASNPAIAGNRRDDSIATFVLPPGWDRAVGNYPVLFNGFYGLHASTFGIPGQRMINSLCTWRSQSQNIAIGVLWNGGGEAFCQTMQESAYYNVSELMDYVGQTFAADIQRVVMTGGSRGGTTAMAMAANPVPHNYRVRYVLSNNGQFYPESAIDDFYTPTYKLLDQVIDSLSLASSTPQATAKSVLLGTPGQTTISIADRSNGEDRVLTTLAQNRTKVLISCGTHDFSRPFVHVTRLIDKIGQLGVGNHFAVGLYYRFGHGIGSQTTLSPVDLLDAVIAPQAPPFPSGVFHYRRDANGDIEEFQPTNQPLVVEWPDFIGPNQLLDVSMTGEPGASVQLAYAPLTNPTATVALPPLTLPANGEARITVPLGPAGEPFNPGTGIPGEIFSIQTAYNTVPVLDAASPFGPLMYVDFLNPQGFVSAGGVTGGVANDLSY